MAAERMPRDAHVLLHGQVLIDLLADRAARTGAGFVVEWGNPERHVGLVYAPTVTLIEAPAAREAT